ncbi:helix-turn-helix transcriptional regulator [Pseudomonas aeruginosa]|nr:helix-turn-helix transcriptional regulator [Pseudomonas aeruginosa]
MAIRDQLHDTSYWLEEVKQRCGCSSDGELARLLNVTKQAVSMQKAGKHEMSVKQAVKVAELLKCNPMEVICGVMFHQDVMERDFWTEIFQQTVTENDRRHYFKKV